MKIGDKVRVYGEETEIIATAYDEDGEEIYMLKGYHGDFYEDEIKPITFELLESIIDLTTEELDKKDKNINATLGYEELVQLRDLWTKKVSLEVDLEVVINKSYELEKERDEYKEAYADYQELGKEYSKLQDEYEALKNQINFNKQRFMCIQEMAETNKKMGELLIKLIDSEEGDHIPRID